LFDGYCCKQWDFCSALGRCVEIIAFAEYTQHMPPSGRELRQPQGVRGADVSFLLLLVLVRVLVLLLLLLWLLSLYLPSAYLYSYSPHTTVPPFFSAFTLHTPPTLRS
jgi:hypothetical protein